MKIERPRYRNLKSFLAYKKLLAICLTTMAVSGCKTEIAIPITQLESTENSVYTESGRFFVVGRESFLEKQSAIYEVVKSGSGYDVVTTVNSPQDNGEDCTFAGLTAYQNTLYAVCNYTAPSGIDALPFEIPTHSILVKVDTDKSPSDESYIEQTALLGASIAPNGMATDDDGNLFISNSYAFVSTFLLGQPEAAIYKVVPSSSGEFSVDVSPWYPPLPTDMFPNGVQITGDYLYYVTGPKLQKIRMLSSGLPGLPVTIYSAQRCNILDDFDISSRGLVATSEIRNPVPDFDLLLSLLPCDDAPVHGQLVIHSSKIPELVYGRHSFEDTLYPSSTRFTKGVVFPGENVVLTDFALGGVTLVSED